MGQIEPIIVQLIQSVLKKELMGICHFPCSFIDLILLLLHYDFNKAIDQFPSRN